MLLKLFKGTGLAVMLILFITAAGLWIGPVLNPELAVYYSGVNTMPLFTMLKNLVGNSAIAGVFISFGLVILISVLMVNFNTTVFFITERTFLPAVLFVILSAILPDCQTLNPALFASLFLLIALIRIVDSYRKTGTAYNFFDAGILISMGSLFYVDLIWMGLLVFLGIALIRSTNIKELVISIIGLLTPYLILYGIYYVLGKDLRALNNLILTNLFGDSGSFYLSRMIVVTLIMTGLNVLASIFHLFSVFNTKKIRSRKTFSLLLWIFVLSAVSFIVLPSVSDEIIYIIAIPVSYFISHFYIFMRKKIISEIFFTTILVLTILVQILYYK
jgi:hypothetical protein